jgi:maltose alpha-D-glucosyltransferase/alpha-amylase
MRYQYELPTKEGGDGRTGSRTPMQWKERLITNNKLLINNEQLINNMGFSSGPANWLYLPVDVEPGAPSVEAQEADPLSLLNTVKSLLCLRNDDVDLQSKPNLEIIHAVPGDRLFVYRRGSCIIAINPSGESLTINNEQLAIDKLRLLYLIGECRSEGNTIKLGAQSFVVWKTCG